MTDYFAAAPVKAGMVRATSGVVHPPVMPNIRENLEYRAWQVLTSIVQAALRCSGTGWTNP